MEVHNVRKDGNRISGQIGDFELWFRTGAGTEPLDSADPFVAAALLPSMIVGSDIVVDTPVSEFLIKNVEELQEVYCCWSPGLRKVAIKCRTTGSPTPVQRIGCFYSGGVDSNHSFLRHEREITELIVIRGFDFDMPAETFSSVISRLTPISESFGKTLMPVETNFSNLSARVGCTALCRMEAVLRLRGWF